MTDLRSGLGVVGLLASGCERVLQPNRLLAGLDDVCTVGQPVEHGAAQSRIGEDSGPLAERQVRCDQKGASFVTLAENLKQQLGVGASQRKIAEFVDLCRAPHNWTHVKSLVMWSQLSSGLDCLLPRGTDST